MSRHNMTRIPIPTNTFKRTHLREAVYKQVPSLSRKQTENLVDEVLEEIILALIEEQSVKLRYFGTFTIRNKKQRPGRNPKTLENSIISARKVVLFKPSQILVAKVNGEYVDELAKLNEN